MKVGGGKDYPCKVTEIQILAHIKYHESFNASAKIEVQDIHKASVYVSKISPHTQLFESIKK